MNSKRKTSGTRLTELDIDKRVEAQADDQSAWGRPVKVRRGKTTPLALPADLAARAIFLAKLHREKNVQSWLARIVKERVELEEHAFSQAKRAMSARQPKRPGYSSIVSLAGIDISGRLAKPILTSNTAVHVGS